MDKFDLGCGHTYSSDFWKDFVADQFEAKKKSFILLQCPHKEKVFHKKFNMYVDKQCEHFMPYDLFKKLASPSGLALAAEVEKTIPKGTPTKLSDFHYEYDKDGMLRHMSTGAPFHFVSQNHYDALGDIIVVHIQEIMKKDFGLDEIFLPIGLAASDTTTPRTNIFMTKDALTNPEKLMLLIQGSGAVRPGQWARALCINDSLSMGTIFPYLKKAMEDGYGIIVFNPNNNSVPKKPVIVDEQMLWSTKPPAQPKFRKGYDDPKDDPNEYIPGSESPSKHCVYVWDHFAKQAQAKKMVIVAHSAGGSSTISLLSQRGTEIFPRLKAIAFTDSVHSITPNTPSEVQNFVHKHAINWVQSKKPLDTPEPPSRWPGIPMDPVLDAPCVSAGHPKHEYTSPIAFPSVFKFLNQKISQ